MIKNSLIWL